MIKVYKIKIEDKVYEVELESISEKEGSIEIPKKLEKEEISNTSSNGEKVLAPMQGVVLSVNVNKGDKVNKGDTLVILEAMKMENPILSPISGTIESINISKGETVNSGAVMITIS